MINHSNYNNRYNILLYFRAYFFYFFHAWTLRFLESLLAFNEGDSVRVSTSNSSCDKPLLSLPNGAMGGSCLPPFNGANGGKWPTGVLIGDNLFALGSVRVSRSKPSFDSLRFFSVFTGTACDKSFFSVSIAGIKQVKDGRFSSKAMSFCFDFGFSTRGDGLSDDGLSELSRASLLLSLTVIRRALAPLCVKTLCTWERRDYK